MARLEVLATITHNERFCDRRHRRASPTSMNLVRPPPCAAHFLSDRIYQNSCMYVHLPLQLIHGNVLSMMITVVVVCRSNIRQTLWIEIDRIIRELDSTRPTWHLGCVYIHTIVVLQPSGAPCRIQTACGLPAGLGLGA